jgi:non-ribosomal peptide synthetase component F
MKRRLRVIMIAAAAGAAVLATVAIALPADAATAVVQFTKIQYDSPGKDTRTNASLVNEYLRITNKSKSSVNLVKWTIKDAAGHTYTFPSHTVGAGKTVYVHTGKGTNGKNPSGKPDAPHLYWNSGNYIWNNDKDTATLRSASGRVYDTCSWKKPGSGATSC